MTTYRTCPNCGERVYRLGCVNCDEDAYIEEQMVMERLPHVVEDGDEHDED